MSVVTGVMLICDLSHREDEPSAQMQEILAWLKERDGYHLKEISDHAGGSKHPQFEAWCGGLNHFAHLEDEFAEFVLSRAWDYPENVVLILQPEEGRTRVFRADCGPLGIALLLSRIPKCSTKRYHLFIG